VDEAIELALRLDPAGLMEMCGFEPDSWQRNLLRSQAARILLLASRQIGKSTCTACVALLEASLSDEALVLMVSRSERQSAELFAKVAKFNRELALVPTARELSLSIQLANGSRLVALPGDPETIRGYSGPRLVVLDEASLIPDTVLAAVLPMTVASKGRLICLSTPMGKRGFFYEKWIDNDPNWLRINAKASECPRIDPAALAEQRKSLGERIYAQEFDNAFVDTFGQLFSDESIEGIFIDGGDVPLVKGF
jgi:hypothetical protein